MKATNIEQYKTGSIARGPALTHKAITVDFRFPVEVADDGKTVTCYIPIGDGQPILSLNEDVCKSYNLNNAEYDAALDAAMEAALRAIIIRK